MAEPDRTNADTERVSAIVAVEAIERIWDFLAPLRQREKGMEISAVFIARMKELEASDQSARDLLNEQDDIIEAQSKALAEARVVKPLEWRNVDASPQSDDWWLEAVTPFGPYTIALVEEHTLPWILEPFRSNLDSNYATEDEAKAAAEADYQQRILSALTPTPENPNG